jgi:hypothetical protein
MLRLHAPLLAARLAVFCKCREIMTHTVGCGKSGVNQEAESLFFSLTRNKRRKHTTGFG